MNTKENYIKAIRDIFKKLETDSISFLANRTTFKIVIKGIDYEVVDVNIYDDGDMSISCVGYSPWKDYYFTPKDVSTNTMKCVYNNVFKYYMKIEYGD